MRIPPLPGETRIQAGGRSATPACKTGIQALKGRQNVQPAYGAREVPVKRPWAS